MARKKPGTRSRKTKKSKPISLRIKLPPTWRLMRVPAKRGRTTRSRAMDLASADCAAGCTLLRKITIDNIQYCVCLCPGGVICVDPC